MNSLECDGEAAPVLLLLLLGAGEALELHVVPDVAVLAGQGRAVLLALPAAGRGQALEPLQLGHLLHMVLQVVVVYGRLLDAAVHDVAVSVAVLNDWKYFL